MNYLNIYDDVFGNEENLNLGERPIATQKNIRPFHSKSQIGLNGNKILYKVLRRRYIETDI